MTVFTRFFLSFSSRSDPGEGLLGFTGDVVGIADPGSSPCDGFPRAPIGRLDFFCPVVAAFDFLLAMEGPPPLDNRLNGGFLRHMPPRDMESARHVPKEPEENPHWFFDHIGMDVFLRKGAGRRHRI